MKNATSHKTKTRTIPAGEFKAKCLQLMDEVSETGLTLIVTKRGKPVVFVGSHVPNNPPRSFIGASKGSMKIMGDIVSALPNEWAILEDLE